MGYEMGVKTSKRSSLAPLAEAIRQARLHKGWSQRELSARANLPQAQISRLETGNIDPQVSTLMELARTLDLDVQLVPHMAVTAVSAAVRSAKMRSEQGILGDRLARLQQAADKAYQVAPEREDLGSIGETLRQLQSMTLHMAPLRLEPEFQKLQLTLEIFANSPLAKQARLIPSLADAAIWLRSLRNQLAQVTEVERPAYSLDDED